jgi:hypothetical protein
MKSALSSTLSIEMPMTISSLPPGFQLMRIKEGEVELCPGVILAGTSRIPHGVELPVGVGICICIYICMRMYACICIYTYILIYIYVYTQIQIYISLNLCI